MASSRFGTTLRVTERCQLLYEVGQGLLNRVWTLRQKLLTSSNYPSLTSEEFAKIRKKLASSFPDQPDCSKVNTNLPIRYFILLVEDALWNYQTLASDPPPMVWAHAFRCLVMVPCETKLML